MPQSAPHASLSHARPCAGHPRLVFLCIKDVDGRDKPGHDGALLLSDPSPIKAKEQPTKPNSTWLILIERSAGRSQIKLMYASHHQQPQKHGRNDEDDPFLVVEDPSMMHAIHGQPPSGYHATPPNQPYYHIYRRRRSLNLIPTSATPISGITRCSIETIQKSANWRSAARQRRRSAPRARNATSPAPTRRSSDVKGSVKMKFPRRSFLHLAAGAAALPAVTRIAWAQTYPSRPVHVIVGSPPATTSTSSHG